jgi:ribosomal protein S21
MNQRRGGYHQGQQNRRSRKNNYRSKKQDTKGSRPSHVTVEQRGNEHIDRTIKRFLKKCKKEGIVEKYRQGEYFEKPSVKRHRAKLRRLAAIRKHNRENKE